MTLLRDFYDGRKVLITGHTGFKGSWLCRILKCLDAEIYGYSLEPPTEPNLYDIIDSDSYVKSEIGDVSDYDHLYDFYSDVKPEVVFHLAAQPIVLQGYQDPRGTYLSNVMGTVNTMECVRKVGAKSVVNITTDKVYDNDDSTHLYVETDRLDGFDPYSNSKSCSELVTHSYVRSFPDSMPPTSTARAGNVIGGGDYAPNRIIPDCIRSAIKGDRIFVRNPNSIRPYQHVLEPLYSYLIIAAKQCLDNSVSGNYNIGPDEKDCLKTGELAELFCNFWGNGQEWYSDNYSGPHESSYLKLDNNHIRCVMGISPIWDAKKAVEKTVSWT